VDLVEHVGLRAAWYLTQAGDVLLFGAYRQTWNASDSCNTSYTTCGSLSKTPPAPLAHPRLKIPLRNALSLRFLSLASQLLICFSVFRLTELPPPHLSGPPIPRRVRMGRHRRPAQAPRQRDVIRAGHIPAPRPLRPPRDARDAAGRGAHPLAPRQDAAPRAEVTEDHPTGSHAGGGSRHP
jgi:hypothetical protein